MHCAPVCGRRECGARFFRAAVVGNGSQTHQGANLVAIERAQLRQLAQQHAGGIGGDGWDALQKFIFFAPERRGADEVVHLVVQSLELSRNERQDFTDAFLNAQIAGERQAIGFHGAQVQELPAAGDPFGKGRSGGVGKSAQRGSDLFGEAGNHGGVDGIGFGEDAVALGKITNLAGIGDDDRKGSGGEVGDELTFVSACSFEDDELGCERPKAFGESDEGLFGRSRREGFSGRVHVDGEGVFGDVDADEERRSVHGDSSLQCGLAIKRPRRLYEFEAQKAGGGAKLGYDVECITGLHALADGEDQSRFFKAWAAWK